MPSKLPRVNVTVTEEQHELLREIARLNGGSAAGILRQQLDAATPLLRAALPLLRKAAEESAIPRAEAAQLLAEPLRLLRESLPQEELYEAEKVVGRASPRAAIARERARTGRARA